MVILGRSISHAKAHARHLMREDQNDRIELLEFDDSGAAPTLESVFTEYQALAEHLTRSKKGLYIATLNPAEEETLTPQQWKDAVDILEQQLGLDDQPRTVVLHEKKGREHAHVVWQRADVEKEIVVDDSWNYRAHEMAAREIEQRFELEYTKGVHSRDKETEPLPEKRGTDLADHQRAERAGLDLKDYQAKILQAFEETEHGKAFNARLEEMGCYLTRGDRKNIFLVLTPEGQEIKLASTLKPYKAKEWKTKLEPLTPEKLKTISEIKAELAEPQEKPLRQEAEKIQQKAHEQQAKLEQRHKDQRKQLEAAHRLTNEEIAKRREAEKPQGLYKVLQDVTGLTWWKDRLQDREDRERLAAQKQELLALKQAQKLERQELARERQRELHELSEENKPERRIRARHEVTSEQADVNRLEQAVRDHDNYLNDKLEDRQETINDLSQRIRKLENRAAYLEGLNKAVKDEFDKRFVDGDHAYTQFRILSGHRDFYREPDANAYYEILGRDGKPSWNKAIDTLLNEPEKFGQLKDEYTAADDKAAQDAREVFQLEVRSDIEEDARKSHYLATKIKNEEPKLSTLREQRAQQQDKKQEILIDLSDEKRLALLRQVEQAATRLSATQIKKLPAATRKEIDFARDTFKDELKRNLADEYLHQHEMKRREKGKEGKGRGGNESRIL